MPPDQPSTPALDLKKCVECGRLFRSTSKPRYAFDRQTGALVGAIHAGHEYDPGDIRHRYVSCLYLTEGPPESAIAFFGQWVWPRLDHA